MTEVPAIPVMVPTTNFWLQLAQGVGVPFVILMLVLTQLAPRVDKQTEIAERTSAYLGVLVSRPPCGG